MNNFSIFRTVKDRIPYGGINAQQLINWVRSDDQKHLVDAIRSAPDKDTRSQFKSRLPAVTVSGLFEKRSATSLQSHSGILVADIDLDENPQLEEPEQLRQVRSRLCKEEHTQFLFSSPSGGLKVGLKIEANCALSHKAAFLSVSHLLLSKHGLVIDKACSDVSRLCFLSHDKEAFINLQSAVVKTASAAPDLPIWEPSGSSKSTQSGSSVGDQFNERGDVVGLLESQGWTTRNGTHWTRPNKSGGISGTLGVVGDRKFYCWSSAAVPLEANTSYSPFALFATFLHGGDFASAAADLSAQGFGESAVPLDPAVIATMNEMVSNALKKEADSWKVAIKELDADNVKETEVEEGEESFVDALKRLSASTDDNMEAMKLRAKEAVFVLPQIAMMGDCTILNAGPNTGKTLLTLWMLCNRDLEATKHLTIFYINADDSFNGGLEKMEVTRRFGIHHLIPNQSGFDPADFSKIIKAAIKADECGDMVIVLDTLKKFVSTMDKNDARIFNIMVRTFTQAGGTLIALAHTNKNKDSEGKSVAEGVGDFQSDFDCAYTIDFAPAMLENGKRTIVFNNTKLRGPNSMKTSFSYDCTEGASWQTRFNSVAPICEVALKEAQDKEKAKNQLNDDQPIIDYLMSELDLGPKSHSALTQNNLKTGEGSRTERQRVLKDYQGKFWAESRGQNGGLNYYKMEIGNLVRFNI